MRKSCRGQGLTLIELLIIMATIAIVVAVSLPVVSSPRYTARIAACAGRHHQLSSAMSAYLRDWDGGFPCGAKMADQHWVFWSQALKKHLPNSGHMAWCSECPCPSNYDAETAGFVSSIGANIAIMWTDYAGYPSVSWTPKPGPCKLTDIQTPNRTILLACSSYKFYGNGRVGHHLICPGFATKGASMLSWSPRVNPCNWRYDFFDPARHGGLVVVTHSDGHVQVYDRNYLLTPGTYVTSPKDPGMRDPNFSMWDLY